MVFFSAYTYRTTDGRCFLKAGTTTPARSDANIFSGTFDDVQLMAASKLIVAL